MIETRSDNGQKMDLKRDVSMFFGYIHINTDGEEIESLLSIILVKLESNIVIK